MRHSDEEIKEAAARFEWLADEIEREPDGTQVEHLGDLQAVAAAAAAVQSAQASLVKSVAVSRGRGRSWNELAVALNVSRQAARQRYGTTSDGSKNPKADRRWAATSRKADAGAVKAAAKKAPNATRAAARSGAPSKRGRKTA